MIPFDSNLMFDEKPEPAGFVKAKPPRDLVTAIGTSVFTNSLKASLVHDAKAGLGWIGQWIS